MAATTQEVTDASGWSVSLTADPSGTRGVFGVVYSLTVVNNSPTPVTLWCVYKGQTLTATARPGTNYTHDFTNLNPTAGQITGWGVR